MPRFYPNLIGIWILLLALSQTTWATADWVFVDDIAIVGNQRTHPTTILRELDFSKGDSLPLASLNTRLSFNETRLLNTRLFNVAKLNIEAWEGTTIRITIAVEEAWYLYPYPVFGLLDPNLAVWWQEQGGKLNRITVGSAVFLENFTGRRDLLRATVLVGFANQYELEYRRPFINRAQTLGLDLSMLYGRNREIPYKTSSDHRFLYLRADEGPLLNRLRLKSRLTYRPRLYIAHEWELSFFARSVADTVGIINPDFFLNGRTHQRYFAAKYSVIVDYRDRQSYPKNGYFLRANVAKEGLGIFNEVNHWHISAIFDGYYSFGKRWSVELILKGRLNLLPTPQPYFMQRQALGYKQDILRGYGPYIIDGYHYGYSKVSLRYALLSDEFNLSKWLMPIKSMRRMPLEILLTLDSDMGYVHDAISDTSGFLTNTLLLGWGVGLDIVVYRHHVFQLEYNMNKLLERFIALRYKLPFH